MTAPAVSSASPSPEAIPNLGPPRAPPSTEQTAVAGELAHASEVVASGE